MRMDGRPKSGYSPSVEAPALDRVSPGERLQGQLDAIGGGLHLGVVGVSFPRQLDSGECLSR